MKIRALIIIPCYNEEKRLPFEEFNSFLSDSKNANIQLLFVNDGSKDETLKKIKKLTSNYTNANVLTYNKNKGKAEAIRYGILQSNVSEYAYVGYFDADLAAPLSEIYTLLSAKEILPNPLLVLGSRVKLIGSTQIERKLSRHYIGRIFATIVSNMLKLPIYDTQCGAKLIRSDIALKLFEKPFISKWLFDVELIFRLIRDFETQETSIFEIPLKKWVHKSGSKIKLWYYFKAPWELAKIYLRYRS